MRSLLTARRAALRAIAGAGTAAMAACVERPSPPPLMQLPNGRFLILGPTDDFNPNNPPAGWSIVDAERGAPIAITRRFERPMLTLTSPGGTALAREVAGRLSSFPHLGWSWTLEPAAFGGGASDGLERGLRLIVGFNGRSDGFAPYRLQRGYSGFPPHDRRLAITLGGFGVTRAEFAAIELSAIAEGGNRRILRPAARNLIGAWIAESVDLVDLYRGFWPADRLSEIEIAFVAVGALPARPGENNVVTIGHVVEIQVFR
jgi:hypothetical protein